MIDLKKLKNDKERVEFLEDYRNEQNGWHLWKHDEELGRWMWRFDMTDISIIVEECLRTFEWPAKHQVRTISNWYITDGNGLFEDHRASRTMALAEIKKRTKR